MYSDPMPGENYENAAEREKALAEKQAIANGENFNPNITSEDAEAFSNLENEVPFAGDAPVDGAAIAKTAMELSAEGPAVAAAGAAIDAGLAIVSDLGEEDGQTPTEMQESAAPKEHHSDNPISAEFNERWDAGQINRDTLNDIQQSVESDYMSGAIEQTTAAMDTQAQIANTERQSTTVEDPNEMSPVDNPHDISEAAAIQAVSAAALSEDLTDKIKAGDEQAISKISEVEKRANEATSLAEKIATSNANNSDGDIEAQMATEIAAQARIKADEAIANVTEAQTEYDAMTEEEKAETAAAAETAEANGTTIEEEKEKAEAEKEESGEEDKYNPDLSRGIFG